MPVLARPQDDRHRGRRQTVHELTPWIRHRNGSLPPEAAVVYREGRFAAVGRSVDRPPAPRSGSMAGLRVRRGALEPRRGRFGYHWVSSPARSVLGGVRDARLRRSRAVRVSGRVRGLGGGGPLAEMREDPAHNDDACELRDQAVCAAAVRGRWDGNARIRRRGDLHEEVGCGRGTPLNPERATGS